MFLPDGSRVASPMFSLENYETNLNQDRGQAGPKPAESRYLSDDLGTLRAIGRLRYELFIERDGKKYEHADHRNRLFLEPVDFVSLNFSTGTKDSRMLSARLTHAQDTLGDKHLNLIRTNSRLNERQLERTMIMSRFAVRDDLQSKMHIPNMLRAAYEAGLQAGAQICLLATRPQMLALYSRFGFAAIGRGYEDGVAGPMQIMRLDVSDRENLIACRSPLLKTHDQFFQTQAFVPQEETA